MIEVRDLQPADRDRWQTLFAGYRDFYRLEPDDAVIARVWGWITDPEHELRGLAALDDGRIVGIAHIRPFARPSTGTVGIYLDDLFTDPDARRRGVGAALIEAIRGLGREHGASVVRWITDTDNTTARSLYDRLATPTRWVTYDAAP